MEDLNRVNHFEIQSKSRVFSVKSTAHRSRFYVHL